MGGSVSRGVYARAWGLGGVVSTLVMVGLLGSWWRAGQETPPRHEVQAFSVAITRAEKAAEVVPLEDAVEIVQTPVVEAKTTEVAVEEAQTALPEAVIAPPSANAGVPAGEQESVLPPAKVAMPGGRLAIEDAAPGNESTPALLEGVQQVGLRLIINKEGRAIFGEIHRAGPDPVRDRILLRAMLQQQYTPGQGKELPGAGWELILALPYGNSDVVP